MPPLQQHLLLLPGSARPLYWPPAECLSTLLVIPHAAGPSSNASRHRRR